MRKIPLTGEVFGWWTVLGEAGGTRWFCKCRCGTERAVAGVNLRSGRSLSCGCLARALTSPTLTHGKSGTRVYRIWAAMIQRAKNPKRKSAKNYVERGIGLVDSRWERFEFFYADMGDPPSDQHSLDRIDNDKGYCKQNCRWATAIEQSRNNRNCRLTAGLVCEIRKKAAAGETVAALARAYGVSESLVRAVKQNLIWKDVHAD